MTSYIIPDFAAELVGRTSRVLFVNAYARRNGVRYGWLHRSRTIADSQHRAFGAAYRINVYPKAAAAGAKEQAR